MMQPGRLPRLIELEDAAVSRIVVFRQRGDIAQRLLERAPLFVLFLVLEPIVTRHDSR